MHERSISETSRTLAPCAASIVNNPRRVCQARNLRINVIQRRIVFLPQRDRIITVCKMMATSSIDKEVAYE
jgi:hypothetical protein